MTALITSAFRREMRFLFCELSKAWTVGPDSFSWAHIQSIADRAFTIRSIVGDIDFGSPLYHEAGALVRWADHAADYHGTWQRSQGRRAA